MTVEVEEEEEEEEGVAEDRGIDVEWIDEDEGARRVGGLDRTMGVLLVGTV